MFSATLSTASLTAGDNRRPDVEPFAFDQVEDEVAGQPAENAGKLYRLGNPEGMRGAARKGDKGRRAAEIKTMDAARSTNRRCRIDEYDRREPGPLLN